ncbi:MAG: class I SAM-dependent methyltransferase [Anaerovoracaceae bacterium]|nr:class I SAM-dependent methyltransferase [Anaerovoracaceae bacterium]
MIQLTPRLAAIANEVVPGETVADIGTDHGFLPAALWEQGISPHVILADVNEGPLNKAKENCASRYPEEPFDFRLGDGLQVLKPGEVDVITIAGMGGILMTEILENDLEKSWSFHRLILQPRNNIGKLRHWLYDHCFSITNEQLVREGRFICEILTVVPVEKASLLSLDADSIEYQYPRRLLEFIGPLTEEYLETRLKTEEMIFESMEAGGQDWKTLRGQKNRVCYLQDLLRDAKKILEEGL